MCLHIGYKRLVELLLLCSGFEHPTSQVIIICVVSGVLLLLLPLRSLLLVLPCMHHTVQPFLHAASLP
jgi:hypothetical protein